MKKFALSIAISCVAMLAGCSASKDAELAQAQISVFHQEFNSGSFHEIYSESSPDLQNTVEEDKLVTVLETVSRKLGRLEASTQQHWAVAALTSGTFVTTTNTSQFERGTATEIFVFRIDSGVAKLAQYTIDSKALD